MPGIADLFSSSAPQAQPVINAPTQTNQQAQEQALNQYRQSQTAATAQDIQMKQRGMQASMLAAGLQKPELLPGLIKTANKLGGVQLDENMTPEQVQSFVMSSVPVEQQPQYGLMQQQAKMVEALRNRLAGNAQPGAGAPAPAGQPPSSSASGGIDPETMMLMSAVNPAMATAMSNVQKTGYESPQGKGQTEYNTASAKTLASNEAELPILQLQLDSYNKALQPHPELGGKSYAETAPGGEYGKLQSQFTNSFPNSPVISNPEKAKSYQMLENILNPASAESAHQAFQRVTGNEYKTFQTSQGLDANPETRPAIIRQTMSHIKDRIKEIQQENQRLGSATGIQNQPQGAAADFAAKRGAQQPSLNVQDQATSLMAAKQAVANGAPKDAVRQRLLDAGINPSLAGL